MVCLPFNPTTRAEVASELHAPIHELIRPHVDSFNFMLETGLPLAVKDLLPVETQDANGSKIKFSIIDAQIKYPKYSNGNPILPADCREQCKSYKGELVVTLNYAVGDSTFEKTCSLGEVPVMVKSDRCHIKSKTPSKLIEAKEEPDEMGGYFIVNGNEKIIRLLILPRRNYVTAVRRGAYGARGPLYTETAVQIRCVKPDASAVTISLHYLSDGSCMFRFSHLKNEYLIPCVYILKALIKTNDKEIFYSVNPDGNNSFFGDRIEGMLRDAMNKGIYTQEQSLNYLGKKFRVVLDCPEYFSDAEVGNFLIDRLVFVHLDNNRHKFDLLIHMIQKLYNTIKGDSICDNTDAPMMQEVLLPGHLYLMILKEKLQEWLSGITSVIEMDIRRGSDKVDFRDGKYIDRCVKYCPVQVNKRLENFLATGNITSRSGLDLQQVTGFVILADKLNFYRYLSHFRCIHRGAFFTEMKTTAVRKLLPEAWGFLCPVHTPDGSPCGLLNHLSHTCLIPVDREDTKHLPGIMASLGMISIGTSTFPGCYLPVNLDGRIIGHVDPDDADDVCTKLRYLKALGTENIPRNLEITCIHKKAGGLFPGVFLFASPARMMRPVVNLKTSNCEFIGSFEQVFMNIAVTPDEKYAETTHVEQHPTNILSVVANMTPFSDLNQSPRNMYQCQMGKQTMGTPLHAYPYRTDNKLYRIHTPQTPIVRPMLYNHYNLDNYPLGTNAVVAVISYTGYDMEDAMILNKGSVERGFGHGTVYKSKLIELGNRTAADLSKRFGTKPQDRAALGDKVDMDGLPFVGARLTKDDPLYCVYDESTNQSKIERYKDSEDATVDQVRLLAATDNDKAGRRLHIRFRVDRNPIIGDKFSSRHGQKGVCSKLWGTEDMPFSETGMSPDLIINPHAFPSRMTIGMLVESMAGKSGAMHGICLDSTPFSFNEKETAYDYFGKQLTKAGYNYYGSERLYSGITGTELEVDIFIGIVYYQRLRHMVSDKFQVRTTGPVDPRTRQPVKGRKRRGGIRLGEMERDALLAHGTSYLLQDRLVNCSDQSQCYICTKCGSILSPYLEKPSAISKKRVPVCKSCNSGEGIETVAVPYVFRYLIAELYSMNIKLEIELK